LRFDGEGGRQLLVLGVKLVVQVADEERERRAPSPEVEVGDVDALDVDFAIPARLADVVRTRPPLARCSTMTSPRLNLSRK
jgi:hypothetical protein